jgi:hypothetical protein
MSTSRRPEPLAAGYTGPVGRRLLRTRRRCRHARDRCRALVRRRVGSTRTFPFDPLDMRLAYGYRRVLLVAVLLIVLTRLGMRLFATELFRTRVSQDVLLVAGFNLGLSATILGVVVLAWRYWRWSRRASVRFAALVDAANRSRRL